ncbi:polysaccharide deacetylase family protein [bacterium]|nr:polysaccharide deacetylase family protein [bacterium]
MNHTVPILLYHRILPKDAPGFDPYTVSVEKFSRQMRYLKAAGYGSLPLAEFVATLQAGAPVSGKRVIITFDDGYRDNITYALPVLKAYGFTPCIFLVSDFLFADTAHAEGLYLSLPEVKAVQQAGWEFQSHGKTHRVLTELPADLVREEVSESKRALESALGKIPCFTYPLGRFTDEIKMIVRESGYSAACGGLPELKGGVPDLFEIGRTEIFEADGMWAFRFKVATGFGPVMYMKKLAGAVKRRLARRRDKRDRA